MLRALGPADYDGTVRLLSMSPALNPHAGQSEKHGFGADFCGFSDFSVVGAMSRRVRS